MRKIDVHGHLGVWNFPIPGGTAENLLRLCHRHDIVRVAISSVLALCYDMRGGNAEVARAVSEHEELLGYVYCNPRQLRESIAEMERYLPLAGFVGVKIHAGYSATTNGDQRMQDLMAEVAQRARVVKIHSDGPDAIEWIGRYAERYPGLAIIMAHACGGAYQEAARMAARHPNLYLEFCSSWAGAGRVRRALDLCGPEQVLFGTDMDLLDPAFVLGSYADAAMAPEEEQMVYWDNPVRVLGLSL